jgi:ribosomal protein S18 acetylase RimI-like enzyme
MLPFEDEKLLRMNSISNISMLGFFAKHNPTKILRISNSIMALGKSDENWWYLCCNKPDDFNWFLDQTGKDDRYLATIDDSILDRVKSRFTCRWTLSCLRLYLPNDIVIPEPTLAISSLYTTDAEHIYKNSNYKQYSSVDYIREQIKQGIGSAYRDGETLAGWVITHDDSAIGMLHVLTPYRQKGVAKALVSDLVRKIRETGLMPYTYVEPSNTASMNLIKSLGFTPDRAIHWVNINR